MAILLQHPDGSALECVAVALGWDAERTVANRIDLNIAALLFGGDALLDVVYHEQLLSRDGSVRHTGDNQTGEGRGDNEVISFNLAQLAPEVTSIMVVVTSYTGQSFEDIDNAYCRLLDIDNSNEITRNLLTGGSYTALVMGKLFRTPEFWGFDGIGVGISAVHVAEAVPHAAAYLAPLP
ncbi:TerD family protein [Nocardia sp. NPDC058058]|uniref:TerD family protein n=1 Tax=Nocardia sp. NPDC058058 TaxID=3346317 RepID=UPI0036D9CDA1